MNYKRLLRLAEIGAKQEFATALFVFQALQIKSAKTPVDADDYDNALISVDKAGEEYRELTNLIEALESF